MSVKDGPSCPGCGLANYEGLCPVCRGDEQATHDENLPYPFDTEPDWQDAAWLDEPHIPRDSPEKP